MYIETSSPRKANETARLSSIIFRPSGQNDSCYMRFWYHMFGQHVDTLSIKFRTSVTGPLRTIWNRTGKTATAFSNTETKEAIHLQREQPYLNQQLVHVNNHVLFDWSNAGEQGDIWRRAEILLVSAVNYQVVIEGLSGPGYQGDIALDDISFTPNCRPDTTATISPIPPSGTPPPGCNSGQYRYLCCKSGQCYRYLCCKSGQYYRYLCCKSGQISLQRKIRNISFSIFHFFFYLPGIQYFAVILYDLTEKKN